jgi:FtsZ-binding cell division protein ZapB
MSVLADIKDPLAMVARLADECERLRLEVERLREKSGLYQSEALAHADKAGRLGAENERLRAALREIDDPTNSTGRAQTIARAALAAKEPGK